MALTISQRLLSSHTHSHLPAQITAQISLHSARQMLAVRTSLHPEREMKGDKDDDVPHKDRSWKRPQLSCFRADDICWRRFTKPLSHHRLTATKLPLDRVGLVLWARWSKPGVLVHLSSMFCTDTPKCGSVFGFPPSSRVLLPCGSLKR